MADKSAMARWVYLAAVSTALARATVAAEPQASVVTLVASAEIHGTPEPCGCSSDPLGDVARIVTLARGGLLLDAGNLLYDPEHRSPEKRPQADATADGLAAIYARGDVGLGPADLLAGPARVAPPRQAVNVTAGIATAPPSLRRVAGVAVGVFGVVAPELLGPALVRAQDAAPAARRAVADLKRRGAQVVVALLGMDRVHARRLLAEVEGISFGVVGAEVGEGMAEAEPVKGAFLVAPADLGRRVAVIELHVRRGVVALKPFASAGARRAAAERLGRKIDALAGELQRWKAQPGGDPKFIEAKQLELLGMHAEERRLETEHPAPPASSYFCYSLVPVRHSIERNAEVSAQLRQLDRKIGEINLRAAQGESPPPAASDEPRYVGTSACQKCHKPAVAFWKQTVHARAWKTLTDIDKQYNYNCTGCHVTGWMTPGGSSLGTVERAGLTNVQCEVCHGPGSKHVDEAGMEAPKSLVLRRPDRFCADNCHTAEHSDTFQLAPYLRDVVGKGHGEALRRKLGSGVTGHELRRRALEAAGR